MDIPDTFKILDYAWGAVTALVGVVWKMNESANRTTRKHIDEKIAYIHKRVDDIGDDAFAELNTQRGHIGKIYEKMEEMSHRANSNHIELLNAIHLGLNQKADK